MKIVPHHIRDVHGVVKSGFDTAHLLQEQIGQPGRRLSWKNNKLVQFEQVKHPKWILN